MIEKVKLWLIATGLTNLGWGAGFIGAMFLGMPFSAGVCAGIFVYLNFNVIRKLVQNIDLN